MDILEKIRKFRIERNWTEYQLAEKSELPQSTHLELLDLGDYMVLDPATLRNLELVRPLNADDPQSTLMYVLDYTVTAMGGRHLREWISHPLISVKRIDERSEAIAELVANPIFLDELKNSLRLRLDYEPFRTCSCGFQASDRCGKSDCCRKF